MSDVDIAEELAEKFKRLSEEKETKEKGPTAKPSKEKEGITKEDVGEVVKEVLRKDREVGSETKRLQKTFEKKSGQEIFVCPTCKVILRVKGGQDYCISCGKIYNS